MMPVLKLDTRQLEGIAQVFAAMPKEAPKIIKRAINHVGNKARTQIVRSLAQQTGMKYGTVRDGLKTKPASEADLAYVLHAAGGHTTLGRFQPRQTRKGVSARPWGKRRIYRGTFIVPAYGGEVFRREGSARGPLDILYGPALPKELLRGEPPAEAQRIVETEFVPRLSHEFKRALLEAMKAKIRTAKISW